MKNIERIKELGKRGITIKAIANVSHLNVGTLYNYIQRQKSMSANKIKQLEEALYLLELAIEPNEGGEE